MTDLPSCSDDYAIYAEESRILAAFSRRLIEIASLSHAAITRSRASNALDALRQPAILLDLSGFVISVNAAAEEILDQDIRIKDGRIAIRDIDARNGLQACLEQLKVMPVQSGAPFEPIVVCRRDKLPVLLRLWPIETGSRWPSRDVHALLTLNALGPRPGPPASILAKAFHLTPSEAKLASIIARGAAPDVAARELKISRETARNQLKSVFAKTGTHRQGELVALLLQVT
jgi:DNA-binding CsgD family transcriptional regulator